MIDSAASAGVVPNVVPFSKFMSPPESRPWWRLFGLFFASLLTTLSVCALVACSPFIFVLTLAQRYIFRSPKFHTQPSELKIAVIGGGWSGLQCMARLKELGVDDVTGFERYDAMGGTWHPSLRYHSVQIHGAMWVTSFADLPFSNVKDVMDGKVIGEEAQRYCQRFADHKGLNSQYKLNSKVVSVKYQSDSRKATLVLEGGSLEGPFDFVIFASLASEPNIPDIPGSAEFNGKIMHSTQFKTEIFDKIVSSKAKVAVVGGSKTGCDLALCFQRVGYPDFSWVYRTPYIFLKYEVFFHDRSFASMLRGLTTLIAFVLSPVSMRLAGWLMWSSGLVVTYDKPHGNWSKFAFGVLCPKQRMDLGGISEEKKVIGNPVRYWSGGLVMDDGRKVDADYIVFGTGCTTGIDKLTFEKDGAPYTVTTSIRMLDYFIVPDFPIFASATSLFTTFGPMRAVNAADMAVYHLCVRDKMTEGAMRRKAARQLGGEVNLNASFVFQNKTPALSIWVTMHVDLVLAGLVDFVDFFWHAFALLCLGQQSPLKFRILPSNHVKAE